MLCKKCDLHKFRRLNGFSPFTKINNSNSKYGFIVFISEYPDSTEELFNLKFLSSHGKLLLTLLKRSFLIRYNWIFSSAVLCVPRQNFQHIKNPTKEELNLCYNNTFEFLKDKDIVYYVLIGKIAQSQFKTLKPHCCIPDLKAMLFAGGTSSSEYLSSLQKLKDLRSKLYGKP
jgi:uracil-DNA glycosylase family 4